MSDEGRVPMRQRTSHVPTGQHLLRPELDQVVFNVLLASSENKGRALVSVVDTKLAVGHSKVVVVVSVASCDSSRAI